MAKLQYWYKSQVEGSAWEDITSQITIHASGSESINNLPKQFSFTISPYIKSGQSTVASGINVYENDYLMITIDSNTIIAHGKVLDEGRKLIGWDYKNNTPFLQFDIKAIESDFSYNVIESMDYTDANISAIVEEILTYADDSLGSDILEKYEINFDDYSIAFSIEKKTSRETLTELMEHIDCFWTIKYSLVEDETETFKVYRYLSLNPKSGIIPDTDNTWYEGIVNKHVRSGTIENPITENRDLYPVIAAESNFNVEKDSSIIINQLDLSCKVFEASDGVTLNRYDQPAQPNLFDYQLDAYADDILYISILVKTKVLSGSTSSTVKVPSNMADNGIINAGDRAYFPDSSYNAYEESNFFEVASVNVINTTYTEITFTSTLPFTPTSNSSFEIISNLEIFRNESEVNYASKGVLIDCDRKSFAKIKFLPLCEPPSGQTITAIYKRVLDYTQQFRNDESINNYGLKYKEIKIDDSITLTREELQSLSSKLLTLKPVYNFSVSSKRYGITPVGLSLSVKITNFITETFILNENEWQFLGGYDKNKQPLFIQNLNLSTVIGNPEKLIQKLQRQKKKTSSNAPYSNKSVQGELVKLQEYITWSFNSLSGVEEPDWTPDTPTITSITDITEDGFRINYPPQAGVTAYKIDVATDSGFTSKVSGYNNKGIFRTGTWLVNGLAETGYTTFYLRMRGITYDNVYSSYTATETINMISTEERILYMKGTSTIDYSGNLYSCKLDGTDEQQHTTTSRVYVGATFTINSDIVYSRSNGTENKLYIIKKSEDYATEYELLDASDNPLSYSNQHVKAANIANKVAYYKENSIIFTDLYIYDLDSRIETALEVAPTKFYLPSWNYDDTNIYLGTINSGDTASNLYISKIDTNTSSISTVMNAFQPSFIPILDRNEEYLFYLYNSSNTYADEVDRIKRYKLDGSENIDIVATGVSTYYSLGINKDNNKLFFCNRRSPHLSLFKLYKCDLDGSNQEEVFSSDAVNYYLMDLKEITL